MPVKRTTREKRPADVYETSDEETFDEDEEQEESYEDEGEGEEEEPEERRAGRKTRRGKRHSRILSASTAGTAGLRHIAELTSKDTEGVTLVRPWEDGWLVEVEVVEDRHIPSTGDMLSLYQAEMDPTGKLLSYRRVRRYRRGRPDSIGEVN